MKIGIVEDHHSVRDALANLIQNTPGHELAGTWPDAETAIRDVPLIGLDVILMDIHLPGKNGIVCVRELKQLQPRLQVIMLTIEEDSQKVFESLTAGACGYLVKNSDPKRILEAIHEVHQGGSPMSGHIARMVVQRFHSEGLSRRTEENLTPREHEILTLIAKGFRAKEIASDLSISVFTVQTHVRNIYEKLHVRTRAAAVIDRTSLFDAPRLGRFGLLNLANFDDFPPSVAAFKARVAVRRYIPRGATVIVVSKGDCKLLRMGGRTGWHFPQQADGTYAGYNPACSLSAIAHLESLRVQGGQYFLFPTSALWWLDHYTGLKRHLDESYRLVARDEDVCRIYSLCEEPDANGVSLSAQLSHLFTEYQTRFGRDPAVLDWQSGGDLAGMFPQFAVFAPPGGAGPLPYLDRTVDIVVMSRVDDFSLAEAHRVVSAAVVTVGGDSGLRIAWQPGMSDNTLPSVSIIIPVYNGSALTDACLESLLRTLPVGIRCEIIVVDDCTTDDTAESLREWKKRDARIKVFRHQVNRGFVDTCNDGAGKASGEILVFLNNDLVLLPGWLRPLVATFVRFPKAGVVGGKLIFPDGTLQEAGGCVFSDGSAMNFGRCDPNLEAPIYNFLREVDYCSGALFATRRELFQKLGGFDTAFRPGYYEDTDYCFKVREAGLKVYFQPESAVVHREGGTAGTDLKQGMKRYQELNWKKFVKRWNSALNSQDECPKNMQDVRHAPRFALTTYSVGHQVRGRALVVSHCIPQFDRNSGDRRIMDTIEFLLSDGWRVTFVAERVLGDDLYRRALGQIGVAVFDSRSVKMDELLTAAHFDLALIAFWTEAEKFLSVIRKVSHHTRVIVDSVDLHFLRNARRIYGGHSERTVPQLDKAFGDELSRELNVYAAADAVLTVSQREADWINELTSQSSLACLLPDSEPMEVSEISCQDRHGIVFIGSFRHPPNVDSVRWLCKEVVPLIPSGILAKHPIYIVGDGMTDEVRRFSEGLDNVKMVGWVPSVIPYLTRARVAVIPLRYGAGTKRKLLQALMAGTPAVSTCIGIEGFNLRDGEHVLVADDARPFADAIARLLRDDRLCKRLARKARAHAEALHGRDAAQTRLRDIVESVLAIPPKSSPLRGAGQTGPSQRMDQSGYHDLRRQLRKFAESVLPNLAKVVVVSRGDDELLKLGKIDAQHFPQNHEAKYAGYHPANSAEAITHLESLRSRGIEFFVLPGTASWWLDHYCELNQHLAQKYRLILNREGICKIFDLRAETVFVRQAQSADTA